MEYLLVKEVKSKDKVLYKLTSHSIERHKLILEGHLLSFVLEDVIYYWLDDGLLYSQRLPFGAATKIGLAPRLRPILVCGSRAIFATIDNVYQVWEVGISSKLVSDIDVPRAVIRVEASSGGLYCRVFRKTVENKKKILCSVVNLRDDSSGETFDITEYVAAPALLKNLGGACRIQGHRVYIRWARTHIVIDVDTKLITCMAEGASDEIVRCIGGGLAWYEKRVLRVAIPARDLTTVMECEFSDLRYEVIAVHVSGVNIVLQCVNCLFVYECESAGPVLIGCLSDTEDGRELVGVLSVECKNQVVIAQHYGGMGLLQYTLWRLNKGL